MASNVENVSIWWRHQRKCGFAVSTVCADGLILIGVRTSAGKMMAKFGWCLSSAASALLLELCFLAQSLWCGMNMLDNWQLLMLPQSEHHEIEPHIGHANFLAPLQLISISLCQSIKNQQKKYISPSLSIYISDWHMKDKDWVIFLQHELMPMTSSNGNIFHVTGPLCGESTGHRWIPLTKASDVELWCFLWFAPEKKKKNDWANNGDSKDLRCHHAHYDVTVMSTVCSHRELPHLLIPFGYNVYWASIVYAETQMLLYQTISSYKADQHTIMPPRASIPAINRLTPLPLDEMVAILQITFSNTFCWMKEFYSLLKFHWSWFLRV